MYIIIYFYISIDRYIDISILIYINKKKETETDCTELAYHCSRWLDRSQILRAGCQEGQAGNSPTGADTAVHRWAFFFLRETSILFSKPFNWRIGYWPTQIFQGNLLLLRDPEFFRIISSLEIVNVKQRSINCLLANTYMNIWLINWGYNLTRRTHTADHSTHPTSFCHLPSAHHSHEITMRLILPGLVQYSSPASSLIPCLHSPCTWSHSKLA